MLPWVLTRPLNEPDIGTLQALRNLDRHLPDRPPLSPEEHRSRVDQIGAHASAYRPSNPPYCSGTRAGLSVFRWPHISAALPGLAQTPQDALSERQNTVPTSYAWA